MKGFLKHKQMVEGLGNVPGVCWSFLRFNIYRITFPQQKNDHNDLIFRALGGCGKKNNTPQRFTYIWCRRMDNFPSFWRLRKNLMSSISYRNWALPLPFFWFDMLFHDESRRIQNPPDRVGLMVSIPSPE